MIFLWSFLAFLIFVGALALSLLIKRRPLPSEHEAAAALGDVTCALCQSGCRYAGGREAHAAAGCREKSRAIAHTRV